MQWEIFQTYSEREQDTQDYKTKHEIEIWQPGQGSSTSSGKVWKAGDASGSAVGRVLETVMKMIYLNIYDIGLSGDWLLYKGIPYQVRKI